MNVSSLDVALMALAVLLGVSYWLFVMRARKVPHKRTPKEVVYGYVYVLSNPSFRAGIFKIGMTGRHPRARAKELRATGVPTHFNVCMVIEGHDYKKLEKDLHDMFSDKRIDKRREFFQLELEDILKIQSQSAVVHVNDGAIEDALRASYGANKPPPPQRTTGVVGTPPRPPKRRYATNQTATRVEGRLGPFGMPSRRIGYRRATTGPSTGPR